MRHFYRFRRIGVHVVVSGCTRCRGLMRTGCNHSPCTDQIETNPANHGSAEGSLLRAPGISGASLCLKPLHDRSWSRVINGLYMKWNRTVLLFLPFLLSFLSQSSLLIYNGPITKTSHFEREKEYRQVNIDRNHGNRVSKRH